MSTFLEEIIELKKKRLETVKRSYQKPEVSFSRPAYLLRQALANQERLNIIAEIKRASPSKGIINDEINVVEVAEMYEKGGACAISVLTEEDRFKGSLEDLKAVRQALNLPILRKDFVFDEFQIHEAKDAGADVILLIVAMLDDDLLFKLHHLAEEKLGLDVLVEVHTLDELNRAKKLGAKIIGVNNRDLHSFKVSLDVSRELIKHKPPNSFFICESGLSAKEELLEMKALGFDGFLIGETLMRSPNPQANLADLVNNKNDKR